MSTALSFVSNPVPRSVMHPVQVPEVIMLPAISAKPDPAGAKAKRLSVWNADGSTFTCVSNGTMPILTMPLPGGAAASAEQ